MSTNESEWREGKSVAQKLLHAGKNSLWTDCTFTFNDGIHEIKTLNSYRLILTLASPVFEAMLVGPLSEKKAIEIVDISFQTFHDLLRCVYTDNKCEWIETEVAEIELVRLMSLYKAAHKYIIPDIMDFCAEKIQKYITPNNACQVYEFASFIASSSNLGQQCINMIQKETKQVFNDPSFTTINIDTLGVILKQDVLNVDSEKEVLAAVFKWCRANKSSKNQSLKTILGSELISCLRILTLSNNEIVDLVIPSTLYSQEDNIEIMTYLLKNPNRFFETSQISSVPALPKRLLGKQLIPRTNYT